MALPELVSGMWALTTALLLTGAGLAVGLGLLPRRMLPPRAWQQAVLALSAGFGALGWVVWVVGSAAGTHVGLGAAWILVLACLPRAVSRRAVLVAAGRQFYSRLAGAPPAPLILLAVLVLLLLPHWLTPAVDSDGLRYHLALPRFALLSGHLGLYPFDVHAALPQGGGMLYLLLLPLAGGTAAKALHGIVFLTCLAVLAAAVHRDRASRTAVGLAPLLYAASPLALAPATAAFVDHLAVLHVAVAAVVVMGRRPSPSAVAIPAAAALLVKWTVAPAVCGLGVMLLWRMHRARRPWLRGGAVCAGILLAGLGPLMVRNALATGDPCFPLGFGILGQEIPGVSPELASLPSHGNAGVPGPLGISYLPGPGTVHRDEVVGPHHLVGLAALLVPLAVPRFWPLTALAVPYLLLGPWYQPPSRLLLPMFWALAALAAAALGRLRRPLGWVAGCLVALPGLWLAAALATGQGLPVRLLAGRITRGEFLSRQIPGWEAARFVATQPPGGVVMALDFPAPFLLDRPWIAEGLLNDPPLQHWLGQADSAEALVRAMQDRNIRYLLVTPGWGGGTPNSLLPLARSPAELALLRRFRQRLTWLGAFQEVDVFAVPPGPNGAPGPPGGG